jgi:hypothetical protein
MIPVAVSAAAVLVIVVLNSNHSVQPNTISLAPSTTIARTAPDRVEILDAAHSSPNGPATIAASGHHDVASKEAAAWREELMPSLPAIAALGIAEIQPDTLTIPQLTVKPLVVAPIDGNNNQR